MDFNVEARRLQLENLQQFISSSKDKIHNVLNSLGWNVKDVLKDNHLITCSLDTNHKVPEKSIENHIKKCALRKEGYDLNAQFLSEPQTGKFSIHIDDHKKIEILSAAYKSIENFRSGWNGQDPDPKTSDRLTLTFSTDERLALYDYAITNTAGPSIPPEFDIVNPKRNDDKTLTYEEKLALERDLKRRKIKYKSVHTSHKNHTEVLREVIEGQMELYRDWLSSNENDVNAADKEFKVTDFDLEQTRSSAVSRNSNTSNSSRSGWQKYKEKYSGEPGDSRSTSRKTSVDRESEKSMSESVKHRKHRSRSHDSHRRYRENSYEKREISDRYRRRDRSSSDRYERHRYRPRRSRERRHSSRDRHRNGYRDYRR